MNAQHQEVLGFFIFLIAIPTDMIMPKVVLFILKYRLI